MSCALLKLEMGSSPKRMAKAGQQVMRSIGETRNSPLLWSTEGWKAEKGFIFQVGF